MTIEENLMKIRKNIPKEVRLLVVSKTRTIEEMEEAYKLGEREFAENKVQELVWKEEEFHKDVKWHLIGNLQTNKVKYIVGKTHLIHSLSSVKLLNVIEKKFGEQEKIANVLIQINIGREDSKTGLLEEDLEDLITEVEKCKYIKVKGLMVIIPQGTEEENKMFFKKTKEMFDLLKMRSFNNITMEILSMGMSGDYNLAISEGSNMVRIGTSIFGARDYSKH